MVGFFYYIRSVENVVVDGLVCVFVPIGLFRAYAVCVILVRIGIIAFDKRIKLFAVPCDVGYTVSPLRRISYRVVADRSTVIRREHRPTRRFIRAIFGPLGADKHAGSLKVN